ncbi:hypothetical protein D3C74_392610 [compost metagenome]
MSFIIPIRVAVPTIVPKVSNSSTNVKMKMISNNPRLIAPFRSSCPTARSLKLGSQLALDRPLKLVTPIGIPISVVATIPINKAPLTRITIRTAISSKPINASNAS